MRSDISERKFVDVALGELKPHPRQQAVYGDMTKGKLKSLRADMDKEGLICPVEITTDNVILAGHQRVRAAKQLGWKTIKCWVRDDLTNPEDQRERLLDDNDLRKDSSLLGKVRVYAERKDVAVARGQYSQKGDLRDMLAKEFGMSGRNMERLLHIIKAPKSVQDAFEARKLTVALAEKVSFMSQERQAEIATRIENGENPKAVVKEYLGGREAERDDTNKALRQILRGFKVLRGREANVTLTLGKEEEMELLREAPTLLKNLTRKIEQNGKERDQERRKHAAFGENHDVPFVRRTRRKKLF